MARRLRNAGVPVVGTAAVYTLTKTSSPVGNVKLHGPRGYAVLNAATFDATALQTAMNTVWGTGESVVGGTGPWTITAAGGKAKAATPPLSMTGASGLTGGSLSLVLTTPGVAATGQGRAEIGCLLTDTTTGILYSNTGTQAAPIWTKVGLQT